MQNGHLDNHYIDFFEKFATKIEVHALESQVRELTKENAGMAVAIQNLSLSMEKMNITMEKMNKVIDTIMNNKNVNEKLKLYWGKCAIGSFTFIIFPILVAHWSGLFKMIFRYMTS